MREGRFGFPRPFGEVLADYRPLIPERFKGAPRNVAAVATAIDDKDHTDKVELTDIGEQYSVDFILDVTGVDEFSRSSLIFTEQGEFLKGEIRAGTVVLGGGISEDMLSRLWADSVEGRMKLNFVEDNISTEIRLNSRPGKSDVGTPHLIMKGNVGPGSEPSPLSTEEVLVVVDRVAEVWEMDFSDLETAGRKGVIERGQEGKEKVQDTVDEMLDSARDVL